MQKSGIVAAVLAVALVSAKCSQKGDPEGASSNITGPAGVDGRPSTGGKPGGNGSSSLTVQMVTDVNGDGRPNHGDFISFLVSTTATAEPHVSLSCSQNGVAVYSTTTGYYAGYPWPWTQTMALWSEAWQTGGADCTATLYYFSGRKTPVAATLNFAVYP